MATEAVIGEVQIGGGWCCVVEGGHTYAVPVANSEEVQHARRMLAIGIEMRHHARKQAKRAARDRPQPWLFIRLLTLTICIDYLMRTT